MILEKIILSSGLKAKNYQTVHGGDINNCWMLETDDLKFFLKINNAAKYPAMLELEARGLKALKENSLFEIPEVKKIGLIDEDQFLLLSWLDEKQESENTQEEAGRKLAEMHLVQQDSFGWEEDNYIGSLKQINTWKTDWSDFYSGCRIMPMIKILFDEKKISDNDLKAAQLFCNRSGELFPREQACFLHGDLWSGNYMNTVKGPSIFDPAVYYGHREMDLGMTKLFGGFGEAFYKGYNAVYPTEKGWKERVIYAQLYPLLVHAVLFGGSYIQRAIQVLKM